MAIAYRGVVRGNIVELDGDARLPEGTRVEVLVPEQEQLTPGGHRKGTIGALLEYLNTPPHATPEDVDALMEEIRKARLPVRDTGIFDSEPHGT